MSDGEISTRVGIVGISRGTTPRQRRTYDYITNPHSPFALIIHRVSVSKEIRFSKHAVRAYQLRRRRKRRRRNYHAMSAYNIVSPPSSSSRSSSRVRPPKSEYCPTLPLFPAGNRKSVSTHHPFHFRASIDPKRQKNPVTQGGGGEEGYAKGRRL